MPDQNLVLRAVSAPVLNRLRPRLRYHQFASDQVLFSAGDKVSNIYFLVSGAVSLVSELTSGQRIDSGIVGRDGVIGGGAALDDRDALYKAIVLIAGSGYALDVDATRQVARDSEEFRTAIIRHEQLILAQAQQSAACNAAHNLNQRLARCLLRARDVTGSDSLPLTQEFLADMLGVRRTSVSLVANTLQQVGLISYRRGQVRIEKPEALQLAACECYGTVKMRYDALLNPLGDRSPAESSRKP